MMAEALRLGAIARGRTAPNPAVGAVVARGEEIVGRGFHAGPGKAHAEAAALGEAGARARGAALYVTLEPCAHHGRTPACAPAVVAAGVSRVVIGTLDPHAGTAGRGAALIREAGIPVTLGVRERACRHLVEDFATWVTAARPWVTAKFAASLDGKIATRTGDSAWITGEAARRRAHELRAEHGAVMVGKGTVLADDPRLTVRLDGVAEKAGPVRVVVASDADLPAGLALFARPVKPPVLVACTRKATGARVRRLVALGAEVIVCRERRGRVDLDDLLAQLAGRGLTSVLAEGGEALLGDLFDRGLVDRVVAFVAPVVIGGRRAKTAVGGSGVAALSDARRCREVTRRRLGWDVCVDGYLTDVNSLFAGVAAATRALKHARDNT